MPGFVLTLRVHTLAYTGYVIGLRQVIGMQHWRSALLWCIGAAVLHRLILLVWMAAVWLVMGAPMSGTADVHRKAELTPLDDAPLTQVTLGVWRRWDAIHYLDLAESGYQASDPGPTVFGILTPMLIGLFDRLLPGPVDVGAVVFGTAAFGLALVLLYRVCEVYYADGQLARWAVVVSLLLPLSYFFSAPMSEALYLATVLGVFYAGAQGRWGWAALAGILATLTRTQGAFLVVIAGLMLLQREHRPVLIERLSRLLRQGWALPFIPLSLVAFIAFREAQGFPALNETYAQYSYVFFVNPIEGLWINLRWMVVHPAETLLSVDLQSLVIILALAALQVRYALHRKLPLLVYTWGSVLIFVTKINWGWGTQEVFFTQSFARYALALFPLTVLAADGIRHAPRWIRILTLALLAFGMAFFSALHALGVGPA